MAPSVVDLVNFVFEDEEKDMSIEEDPSIDEEELVTESKSMEKDSSQDSSDGSF